MSRSAQSPVRVLVTGAGGFIGHHLVGFLKERGYWVRGVDLKDPEYAPTVADEFQLLDMRRWENCLEATPQRAPGGGCDFPCPRTLFGTSLEARSKSDWAYAEDP